jgi:putative zinc finger/helix-turn-helix YgiT family protein
MNKTNCCPFCQTETTEAVTYSSDIKFGRRTINVAGLKKAVCTSCGSESVSAQMHDENLDLILKAEESTQGAVTPGLLRALREQWNLTQVEASKLFGAGKSSFAKWESAQTKLSTPTALLLQVASHIPEVVPYLAKLSKVEIKSHRNTVYANVSNQLNTGAYETIHLTTEAQNGEVFWRNTSFPKYLAISSTIKAKKSKWVNAEVTEAARYNEDLVEAA